MIRCHALCTTMYRSIYLHPSRSISICPCQSNLSTSTSTSASTSISVNLIYLGTPRATCTRVASRWERSTAAASTPPPSAASLRVSGLHDVQLCIYTHLPTFVPTYSPTYVPTLTYLPTYLPTYPPPNLPTYLPIQISSVGLHQISIFYLSIHQVSGTRARSMGTPSSRTPTATPTRVSTRCFRATLSRCPAIIRCERAFTGSLCPECLPVGCLR